MIKYFSVFSGIGGFELGIKQAIPDAECVGFSEIDKYAISIYKKHFKGHKNYGDATKIVPSKLPDFDCLVGGFPCQAFSIAGKRGGFSDTRGTLFFEIARVLREKQPRFLVLENVKGLLSHDQGNSVNLIMSTLDELGYNCQWHICNSKNHRVAQNRERIFIVGHLRINEQSAREIFPLGKSNEETAGTSGSQNTKINCFGNIDSSGNGANGNVFSTDRLCSTLTTNKGEGLKVVQLNQTNLKSNNGTQPYCQDRVYSPNGLSPALNQFVELKVVCFSAERGFRDKDPNLKRGGSGILSRDDGVSYVITAGHANHPVQLVGGSQGNRVYDSRGIAVTQQALSGGMGTKTGLYYVDGCIRRLMPIECERLQGFPDDWTKYGVDGEEISDTQRYKCCGNAVTVNVVADIFKQIMKD